jgi:hypothetical protein
MAGIYARLVAKSCLFDYLRKAGHVPGINLENQNVKVLAFALVWGNDYNWLVHVTLYHPMVHVNVLDSVYQFTKVTFFSDMHVVRDVTSARSTFNWMYCIIVWGLFCWKCVRVKSYVYIYMYSALTWMQILVTCTPEHAHRMPIFSGVYLLWRQRKGKRYKYHSYSDARSLVTFFWGVILWQQETRLFFTMIQKKREHQNTRQSDFYSGGGGSGVGTSPSRTNHISSCFDTLSITYKSLHIQQNSILMCI